MTLVHLFCLTAFFKFTFSKNFFCEKDFFFFFFNVIFFCKTKNLTKNPIYTKSKGPNIFKA